MLPVIYDSADFFLIEKVDPVEKVRRMDIIIASLEDAALRAAGKEERLQYELDDGQSKIKMMYRGASGIANAINAYEVIRQRYINRYQGRMVRLVDQSNFVNRYYNC